MDHLSTIRVFVEVVERNSFTIAAEKLNLSRAQVSKSVAQLESHLNVRLLNRTTRRISLTEMGKNYYPRYKTILEELAEIDSMGRQEVTKPSGKLVIGAPTSFGVMQMNRLIPDFLKQYPDVQVDIQLTDRMIDIVEEGYDIVIRIAKLKDSSLIARKIAPCRIIFCASPYYLKQHGTPQTLQDLKQHNCLIYTANNSTPETWEVQTPTGQESVKVKGTLHSDNGDILSAATKAGLGIALQPTFIIGSALKNGELQQILPEYSINEIAIYAVYPSRRYLSAKVKAFVDYLAGYYGDKPEWDGY